MNRIKTTNIKCIQSQVRRWAVHLMILSVLVISFQNCDNNKGSQGAGSSDQIEAGETAVPTIYVDKTDRILHSRNVGNALIQALGVKNDGSTNNLDPIIQGALNSQMLLSEDGKYDSVTGGQLVVQLDLAEVACERSIFHSELTRLSIDGTQIEDKRRFFRGIYLGDSAASATAPEYDPATLEMRDSSYGSYTPYSRYRAAIKRLARSLWKRDSSTIEEDEIIAAIQPVLSGAQSNRGFRASVMLCAIMASSFDFLRQ